MQTEVPCNHRINPVEFAIYMVDASWGSSRIGARRKELNFASYLVHPSVLVLDDVGVAEARHEGHLRRQAK